mmetsp:Transcript_6286/g.21073  ORF Transcript_6286/g.21073 Transcript_6286/m.21073 type:complete len:265 (+) Transcript_6286:1401-2195(+)
MYSRMSSALASSPSSFCRCCSSSPNCDSRAAHSRRTLSYAFERRPRTRSGVARRGSGSLVRGWFSCTRGCVSAWLTRSCLYAPANGVAGSGVVAPGSLGWRCKAPGLRGAAAGERAFWMFRLRSRSRRTERQPPNAPRRICSLRSRRRPTWARQPSNATLRAEFHEAPASDPAARAPRHLFGTSATQAVSACRAKTRPYRSLIARRPRERVLCPRQDSNEPASARCCACSSRVLAAPSLCARDAPRLTHADNAEESTRRRDRRR